MNLEINDMIKKQKPLQHQEIKYYTSEGERVMGEIKKEIKNFLQINENTNKIYQNLLDRMKTFLRGDLKSLNSYT